MVGHRYTEEEHTFLRNFIPGHTYKEIVQAYNQKFKQPITESRVKSYMSNHKLKNGLTGRFEKGHVPVNKGTHPPTVGRMGDTQFKKGHLPHNTKPIGYERMTRDGYIEVKVMERPDRKKGIKNFVPKHRLVWEAANGPIPKGNKIIFLDGDKNNCDIENLAMVNAAENLELLRCNLRSENPKLTETGVLVAKLAVTTNRKRG